MAATYDLKIPLQRENFTSIPTLDFAQVSSPSTKPVFVENLRDALVNVGFFYLRNAPISPDLQSVFTAKSLELFQLPLDKKLEIEMVNSPHFLGYSKLGAEITALKQDHREQFDASFCFQTFPKLSLIL
jgi:isopenicillin N synthase-like dioxygenase